MKTKGLPRLARSIHTDWCIQTLLCFQNRSALSPGSGSLAIRLLEKCISETFRLFETFTVKMAWSTVKDIEAALNACVSVSDWETLWNRSKFLKCWCQWRTRGWMSWLSKKSEESRDDAKLNGGGSELSPRKLSRKLSLIVLLWPCDNFLSILTVDKRMSARLTRSKAKQRTEMPDTEAKLDAVLAKMDDLLAAKDEQESKLNATGYLRGLMIFHTISPRTHHNYL